MRLNIALKRKFSPLLAPNIKGKKRKTYSISKNIGILTKHVTAEKGLPNSSKCTLSHSKNIHQIRSLADNRLAEESDGYAMLADILIINTMVIITVETL